MKKRKKDSRKNDNGQEKKGRPKKKRRKQALDQESDQEKSKKFLFPDRFLRRERFFLTVFFYS